MPSNQRNRVAGWIVLLLGTGALLVLFLRGGREVPIPRDSGEPTLQGAEPGVRRISLSIARKPKEWKASSDPKLDATSSPGEPTLEQTVEVTQDGGRRQVEGASVSVVASDGRLRGEGRTDEGGLASFRLSAAHAEGAAVVVRVSGRATAVRRLPGEGARRVVDLSAGADISGRVRLAGGGSPPGGLRVVARPFMSSPTGALVFGADGVDHRIASTMTSANGEFRVEGLTPGSRFDLDVAGVGLAAETVRRVPAGAMGLELVVQPVYGIILRFVDDQANSVARSPGLVAEGQATTAINFAGVGPPLSAESVAGKLLGLSNCRDLVHGASEAIFAFGDGRPSRLGPIPYTSQLPGFAPRTLQLWLERIEDSVPVLDVPLRASDPHGGSATVRVRIDGSPPGARVGPTDRSGYLRFDGGSSGVWYADVLGPPTDERVIRGVPAGNYGVSFRPLFADGTGIAEFPETTASLVVGSDVAIQVAAPPGTSVLTIELLHEDGLDATPVPWSVEVESSEPSRGRSYQMTFSRWSAILCGMTPGEYRIRASIDDEVESRPLNSTTVRVEPDRSVQVRFDARRAP